MKFRALCLGFAAVVSLTSGCIYKHHPCWGFRLHPCQHRGECAPACCSSPVSITPMAYKPTGGECCLNGGSVMHSPAGLPVTGYPPTGYPPMAYPPVIGPATPLPGASIIPSHELPNPMPVKPGGQ